MGSSPPVCSFTASLIQVAHVESRCATIIYMNGIENFLLGGGEKDTREREPTPTEGGRRREEEGGRRSERTDTEKERERERGGDTGERQGRREIQRGRGKREDDREDRGREDCVGGEGRAKGEGENLLAFYVGNYTKDGITYPTGRPADSPLPLVPFAASQPANTRPPLSLNPLQPPVFARLSNSLCPSPSPTATLLPLIPVNPR